MVVLPGIGVSLFASVVLRILIAVECRTWLLVGMRLLVLSAMTLLGMILGVLTTRKALLWIIPVRGIRRPDKVLMSVCVPSLRCDFRMMPSMTSRVMTSLAEIRLTVMSIIMIVISTRPTGLCSRFSVTS